MVTYILVSNVLCFYDVNIFVNFVNIVFNFYINRIKNSNKKNKKQKIKIILSTTENYCIYTECDNTFSKEADLNYIYLILVRVFLLNCFIMLLMKLSSFMSNKYILNILRVKNCLHVQNVIMHSA